ncbi:MAG: fibro-slime domain-containing protein, partial [Desulfobulbaceae bacterium]|nr:fibro-slime domain-containing protein [Desulfobulbaceae bacterium]
AGVTAGGPSEPPDSVTVTGTVRDFRADHPDFEGSTGSDRGIVETTLGSDGKPVYAHPGSSTGTTSGQANFDQWYRDVPGVNISSEHVIEMTKVSDNPVQFEYTDTSFFPIDDQGWGNAGHSHNYWFTYEIDQQFTYQGGETLSFRGDDDLFVFINDHLVIDLGGVHPVQSATVNLDAISTDIGIEVGGTYGFDLFFAERHTTQSNFLLTTSILLETPEPVTYRWTPIGQSGPPVTLSDPTSPTPSFRVFDDGVYEFELTVTQGAVQATDRVKVTVDNA